MRRYRRRRRSNPVDLGSVTTLVVVGGIGLALYYLWPTISALFSGVSSAASAVGTATTAAGNATGGALFDLFNPGAAGNLVYYTVNFPDGSTHTVPSNIVDGNGYFTYAGNNYVLITPASGNRIAQATSIPSSISSNFPST